MKGAVAFLALAMLGLWASQAAADCCNDCGCQCDCCKVCRCVPTKKKITKICYGCECEDFCVPGPSKICGWKCVENPCENEGGCGCGIFSHLPHCFSCFNKEPIFQPTCAKIHTRSRLVKKEVTKEVPSWKWEVVDLCPKCKACTAKSEQAPPENATVQQASAGQEAAEYYSQNEVQQAAPTVAPGNEAAPADAQTELVSHKTSSQAKRLLLPVLAK